MVVLTVAISCSLAFLAPVNMLSPVAAQSLAPSGTYGFEAGVSQIDSVGANGGAILGVITFDGMGGVSGNAIVKPRDTNVQNAQAAPGTFTGTYTVNPDGTGSVTMTLDLGFSITFAMATVDGGQGLQLVGAAGCSPCGADIPLRVQDTGLSGNLPVGLFLQGAAGNIPVTLTSKTAGNPTAYTATTPAAGSGTAQCPDGSTGNWTAELVTLTVASDGNAGNFLAAVIGKVCGKADFETVSGMAYTNFGPGGTTNLVLHAVSGGVAGGLARVLKGGTVSGSYGVQLNYSPFPAGTVGVMKFDGEGNVAVSFASIGGTTNGFAPGTFTGTYSTNPDGTGTINLRTANGQAGPVYAFVTTDGGSQLLLLRTDANPQFNVAYGTARMQ